MRHPAYLAGTLVVAKDEQLVLHDWGAEGAPELISLEHAPLWIEVTARVEFFVAQEFVNRTVNFVGARLGDHGDLDGIASIFRAEVRSRHIELCDRIRIWNCRSPLIADRVRGYAVDSEFTLIGPVA